MGFVASPPGWSFTPPPHLTPVHPLSPAFVLCAGGGVVGGGTEHSGGRRTEPSNLYNLQNLTKFISTNGGHSVIQTTEFSDCVRGVPGFLNFDKCPPSSPRF